MEKYKMQILKVCLLIGESCKHAEYKYIESEFQIKTCTANHPCSHQYTTSEKELAEIGPCEKADFCPMASEACKLAYNKGALLPSKRWINCIGWFKCPDALTAPDT
jgi:hypothetical protein